MSFCGFLFQLFNSLPFGVVAQAADGRIVFSNPAAQKILGLSEEEILGRTSKDPRWRAVREDGSEFPGEEHPAMVALRTGRKVEGVVMGVYNPREGKQRWLRVTAIPLETGEELIEAAVYTVFEDITEHFDSKNLLIESRKHLEKMTEEADRALRELSGYHALVKSIFERSPVAIEIFDEKGRLIEVNKSCLELFGVIEPEEIVGFNLFTNPNYPEGVEEKLKKGEPVTFQREYDFEIVKKQRLYKTRKSGRITIEVTISPTLKDGRIAGYVVQVLDLTGQKTAEKEREREHSLLMKIAETSPVGLLVTDIAGNIIFSNETAKRLLGLENLSEDGKKAGLEWGLSALKYALTGSKSETGELFSIERPVYNLEDTIIWPDGRKVVVAINATPLYDDNGKKEGILTVISDITEKKHLEEEQRNFEARLQYSQKLESLGMMAGGIAHDFNNLLMVILGNAELALNELPRGSPAVRNLNLIVRAAGRAAEISSQMLVYAGKGQTKVEEVDISELIQEMSEMLEVTIPRKIHFVKRLSSPIDSIEGDPGQLRQLVMNLILNAVEAIGDREGEVELETGVCYCDEKFLRSSIFPGNADAGMYVYLMVSDNGCGIEEEFLEKIFDPFFTTKFLGRGLGLAVVQGIVKGHRGFIHVESVPGHGTKFKVFLPSTRKTALKSAGSSEEKLPIFSGRALVVDDEKVILELVARMVESLGFEVIKASNGQEALLQFEKNSDNLTFVLLDLTMPGKSGKEIYVELRKKRPGLPVLLSSGYSIDEVKELINRDPEVTAFIQKPYVRAKLAGCLDMLLGMNKN